MTLPQVEQQLLGLAGDGPSVVAIGGGHGLAQLLHAIRVYAGKITAIVNVADDGGSSGRLIQDLPMPPPGDVRRALLALTPGPSIVGELFAYRFDESDVAGHSLGNLLLAALAEITDDFPQALDVAADLLRCVGRVLPASAQRLHLEAIVDGERVRGQVSVATTPGTIERLDLLPADAPAVPAAAAAIREADQVVLAPGSLYTSLFAALRAPGIADAVDASTGDLVWVMNLVTQEHETAGMTGLDHVAALADVSGIRRTGTILINDGPFEVPDVVDPITIDVIAAMEWGWSLCSADLVDRDAPWPQHDPFRLGRALSDLAEDA